MQILFTHGYFLNEDAREQEIMRPYVPLGILYLSSFLETNGYANEVFDSTFSSFELLEKHLTENRPDVIGIYVNLMTKLNVLKIIRLLKENSAFNNIHIILGGPEVRNHAEQFLNFGAEVIVVGRRRRNDARNGEVL
jgi:anaerobic magnesium-protoporphyrin IX monomethyl ester cyclase